MRFNLPLQSLVALAAISLMPVTAFAQPGSSQLSGKCTITDIKLVTQVITAKVQSVIALDSTLKPGSAKIKVILPKLNPAATVVDPATLSFTVNSAPDDSNPYKVTISGNNSALNPIDLPCIVQANVSIVVKAKKTDGSSFNKRQDGLILNLKGQLK